MPLNITQRIHSFQHRFNALILLIAVSNMIMGCSIAASSKTSADEPPSSSDKVMLEEKSEIIATDSVADTPENIGSVEAENSPPLISEDPSEQTQSSPPITEDTIEPATLEAMMTQGIETGMRYGEARQRLIDQGWIPYTIQTGGPAPKLDPWLGEKQMLELGFDEVVDCSGTGRGYCRFEFVFKERAVEGGPILAVTTYASSDISNPEPFFAGLSVRRDHINSSYQQQKLNAAIFKQIQEEEKFEHPFGIEGAVQYDFSKSVLSARSYEFGNTITLFPKQPLSKQAALDYARVLDPAQQMDWENYSTGIEEDVELYFPQGYVIGSGPVTTVTFQYTMTGKVSAIRYTQPFI